jgi:hypothetical protein
VCPIQDDPSSLLVFFQDNGGHRTPFLDALRVARDIPFYGGLRPHGEPGVPGIDEDRGFWPSIVLESNISQGVPRARMRVGRGDMKEDTNEGLLGGNSWSGEHPKQRKEKIGVHSGPIPI